MKTDSSTIERPPRSNRERTDATRQALIDAARSLFVQLGYGDTSTPAIVAAAHITRGALYHHFADKRDLFRAVLEQEARAVAQDIEAAAPAGSTAREALLAGSDAYLAAMRAPGRTRLLLVDAPAVLGPAEARALDDAHAARSLHEGLGAALEEAGVQPAPLAELAALLSAAFDHAALAVDAGGDPVRYRAALSALVESLLHAR
jgi:AcrR family transcriptional regulator